MRGFTSLILLLAAILLAPSSGARKAVNKIKVQGELKVELNAVLKASVDLQEASVKGADKQASTAIKKLIQKISAAQKKSTMAKDQRTHMLKMLTAAKTALEKSRRLSGSDRHTFMQTAFKQIVGLSETYQLDKYKTFFCPKDRSVWLQRGNKAQNPVNPETLGSCGKPV